MKIKIELNHHSWLNLVECVRDSKIKSKGNFWASIQSIEEQLGEQPQ